MSDVQPVTKTRITWRDWQLPGTPDPDELLTREEMVERLKNLGIPVAHTTLRYWELIGVLPRGVRMRRNKVTGVYFPRWLLISIVLLRRLQELGWSLQKIASRLRETAPDAIHITSVLLDDTDLVSQARRLTTDVTDGVRLTQEEAEVLLRLLDYTLYATGHIDQDMLMSIRKRVAFVAWRDPDAIPSVSDYMGI